MAYSEKQPDSRGLAIGALAERVAAELPAERITAPTAALLAEAAARCRARAETNKLRESATERVSSEH